ncbi:hypothetical protein HDV00_001704, partial [Rhizophlyctis rosea]
METVRNMVAKGESLTKSSGGKGEGEEKGKKKKGKGGGVGNGGGGGGNNGGAGGGSKPSAAPKGEFNHFRFGPSSSHSSPPPGHHYAAAGLGVLVDEQGRPVATTDPMQFLAGMQTPSGVGNHTIGEVIAHVLGYGVGEMGGAAGIQIDPAPILAALSGAAAGGGAHGGGPQGVGFGAGVPVPWEVFGMRPVAGPLPPGVHGHVHHHHHHPHQHSHQHQPPQQQGPMLPPPPTLINVAATMMSPAHPPPPPPPVVREREPARSAAGTTQLAFSGLTVPPPSGTARPTREIQHLEQALEASRNEERQLERKLVEVVRRNRGWQREVAQVLELEIVSDGVGEGEGAEEEEEEDEGYGEDEEGSYDGDEGSEFEE